MSSPYGRILKRAEEKGFTKKVPGFKANLHRISFEDSDDSSRIDIPNIFLDDRENTEEAYSPVKIKKKEPPIIRQESEQVLDLPRSPTKRIQPVYNEPEPEPEV